MSKHCINCTDKHEPPRGAPTQRTTKMIALLLLVSSFVLVDAKLKGVLRGIYDGSVRVDDLLIANRLNSKCEISFRRVPNCLSAAAAVQVCWAHRRALASRPPPSMARKLLPN
jgi:hypothetical protein